MWREPRLTAFLSILCVLVMLCAGNTGCDDDEPAEYADPLAAYQNATPGGEGGESGQEQVSVPRSRTGVDEQDDPNAPASLPRSNELPGWVKVQPVRIAEPGKLARVVPDPDLLGVLDAFRIRRAAACAYEGPAALKAEVLFIEAAGPVDSFGLFSVMTHTAGLAILPQDQSIRAIEVGTPSWTMLAWQGDICARLSFADPGRTSAMQLLTQLFNRVVFSVPNARPPLIFQVMEPERLLDARVWVVRRTAALKHASIPALNAMAGEDLDARLGLCGEEVLWLASVPSSPIQPEEESDEPASRPFLPKELRDKLPPVRIDRPTVLPGAPNLVWFVQYTRAEDAQSAYDRYSGAIAAGRTDRDRNTALAEPQGLFLAGTWTADVEARQLVIPEILHGLSRAAFKESAETVAAP